MIRAFGCYVLAIFVYYFIVLMNTKLFDQEFVRMSAQENALVLLVIIIYGKVVLYGKGGSLE